MFHKDYYKDIFSSLKNCHIGLVSLVGNYGDELILKSTQQLLDYYKIKYSFFNYNSIYDVILINGGGNFGTAYKINYNIRKNIYNYSYKNNSKIIVLPSTVYNLDDNESIDYIHTFYAREKTTLNLIKNSILYPDLSFSFNFSNYKSNPIYKEGVFLRCDSEKYFTKNHPVLGNNIDPIEKVNSLHEYINLASNYKTIHTNRMHFAIMAFMLNRKVIFYPNSYFKNKSFYETWLKDYENIEFVYEN